MSEVVAAYDQDHPIVDPEDLDFIAAVRMGDYDTLLCPLTECTGELYIEWTATMVLSASNTIGELVDPKNAHSTHWEIGCTEGHTLLLPDSHADDSNDFMQECRSSSHDDYPYDPDDPVVYHDDIGRLRRLLRMT